MSDPSGLDESVLNYVGKTIYVRPDYGWGWVGVPHPMFVPRPFLMRLDSLWDFRGETRRGGIGQVDNPGHEYHGYWVVFDIRHVGTWNFTDRICAYNIALAPWEPEAAESEGSPQFGRGKRYPSGYASIAKDEETLRRYEEEWRRKVGFPPAD